MNYLILAVLLLRVHQYDRYYVWVNTLYSHVNRLTRMVVLSALR